MAQLLLTKCWINLVATGAAVTAQSAPGRAAGVSVDGSVHTYAGGRQRSITRAGVRGSYTVTLRLMPRADVDTLKSWLGLTVQVRDNLGRLVVGVFYAVPEAERKGQATWDVDLVVQAVSV